MGNSKKIASSKRKELYNEVLMLSAKHFDKDVPSDLLDCLGRGPGTKYPVLLCSYLMTIKELTGNSLYTILYNHGIEEDPAIKVAPKWLKWYKESRFLQKDVAIICMLVREKHCNNNKRYE